MFHYKKEILEFVQTSHSYIYFKKKKKKFRFIQTMRDHLSEVGQARAWIHLALEKKMLSQHLKELLTNPELLRSQFTDLY